jgi:hypothetical protein
MGFESFFHKTTIIISKKKRRKKKHIIHRGDACYFRSVLLSTFYSENNPYFTAGKRIGNSNCHATFGHQTTAIYTFKAYIVNTGVFLNRESRSIR